MLLASFFSFVLSLALWFCYSIRNAAVLCFSVEGSYFVCVCVVRTRTCHGMRKIFLMCVLCSSQCRFVVLDIFAPIKDESNNDKEKKGKPNAQHLLLLAMLTCRCAYSIFYCTFCTILRRTTHWSGRDCECCHSHGNFINIFVRRIVLLSLDF